MYIIKRNNKQEEYQIQKIINAIQKAFESCKVEYNDDLLYSIAKDVENTIKHQESTTVEQIQDLVEEALMKEGFYSVAKSYILYRETRSKQRKIKNSILSKFKETDDLEKTLNEIEKEFSQDEYNLDVLNKKFSSFVKENQTDDELIYLLIKAAVELISNEAPNWEFIGARLLMIEFIDH